MYLNCVQTALLLWCEMTPQQERLESRSSLLSTSQRKPAGTAKDNDDMRVERQTFPAHVKTIVSLWTLQKFYSSEFILLPCIWSGSWTRWLPEVPSNLNGPMILWWYTKTTQQQSNMQSEGKKSSYSSGRLTTSIYVHCLVFVAILILQWFWHADAMQCCIAG